MPNRHRYHDPAPARGMRGAVFLVAVLFAGLIVITAVTGKVPGQGAVPAKVDPDPAADAQETGHDW